MKNRGFGLSNILRAQLILVVVFFSNLINETNITPDDIKHCKLDELKRDATELRSKYNDTVFTAQHVTWKQLNTLKPGDQLSQQLTLNYIEAKQSAALRNRDLFAEMKQPQNSTQEPVNAV